MPLSMISVQLYLSCIVIYAQWPNGSAYKVVVVVAVAARLLLLSLLLFFFPRAHAHLAQGLLATCIVNEKISWKRDCHQHKNSADFLKEIFL